MFLLRSCRRAHSRSGSTGCRRNQCLPPQLCPRVPSPGLRVTSPAAIQETPRFTLDFPLPNSFVNLITKLHI